MRLPPRDEGQRGYHQRGARSASPCLSGASRRKAKDYCCAPSRRACRLYFGIVTAGAGRAAPSIVDGLGMRGIRHVVFTAMFAS
jgi:hypothetical protein